MSNPESSCGGKCKICGTEESCPLCGVVGFLCSRWYITLTVVVIIVAAVAAYFWMK